MSFFPSSFHRRPRWPAVPCGRTASALVLSLSLLHCGGDGGTKDAGTAPDGSSATLTWYKTCGDPVCRGYTAPAGVPKCTTETVGSMCTSDGQRCDPMDACNALLICAKSDPKTGPGGCPISRRDAKQEIQYLDDAGRARLADEIQRTKLATYRYKTGGPVRLGFLIDDQPLSMSVDPSRDMIDLYGYTSMAVAAIQQQAQRIAALEAQLSDLKQARGCAQPSRRPAHK